MIKAKKIKSSIWKIIKTYGNLGTVLRVVSRPIAGTRSTNQNSYDDDGNEIIAPSTIGSNGSIERLEFKYASKQLRGLELSPTALNSGQIRFSCISTNLTNIDYMKNKIVKGDEFIGYDETKYSIDEIHHVGQMQGTEFLLELICSRV